MWQDYARYLAAHFMVRWLLANVVGWSIGLYLGSFGLRVVGGLLGMVVGGALVGAIVGGVQWWALRRAVDWAEDRRWIIFSAIGGALGALPAFLASVSLLAGWTVGFFIIGGLFGGVFGAVQMILLNNHVDSAGLWAAANIAGGGLCGMLALALNPAWLPVCCSLGPLVFGAITGFTLLRLLDEPEV